MKEIELSTRLCGWQREDDISLALDINLTLCMMVAREQTLRVAATK
jgi:hypothetical protein